jgi:hypothetical protein
MFNQIWKKHLPLIYIFLKKAILNGEQIVKLNQGDFERASGGRKTKYTFSNLHINYGKINYTVKSTSLATDFALLMLADANINNVLKTACFEFVLKGDFTLIIKPKIEEVATTIASDKVETEDSLTGNEHL